MPGEPTALTMRDSILHERGSSAGRDGGRPAAIGGHCFVAPSFSIHRIQEAHTVLLHLLRDQVRVALGEEDVL